MGMELVLELFTTVIGWLPAYAWPLVACFV
jgi:hypothetical protein